MIKINVAFNKVVEEYCIVNEYMCSICSLMIKHTQSSGIDNNNTQYYNMESVDDNVYHFYKNDHS